MSSRTFWRISGGSLGSPAPGVRCSARVYNSTPHERPAQLRRRDPRQPALRLVGRRAAGGPLSTRPGRAALELRDLDRPVALQPDDGAPAAHEPAGGVRVRVLQAGLPALRRAARRARHGVQEAAAVDVPADLPEAHARLPNPRARLDARA